MELQSILYRPAIHYTPALNFMNDPNGLIYEPQSKTYHMYYQYNPYENIAGNQHWGHTTSKDLLHWVDQPIAISPKNSSDHAFTGSVVIDQNNTSKLFPGKNGTNFVAIYTQGVGDDLQQQSVMYSTDGGKTYQSYKENPVLNLNSSSFRDPQVQWLPEHEKWLMSVALAREHKVQFYESDNLLEWTYLSDFQAGIYGVDYECPNLVPVKDEDGKYKYALFVSINPGMPQGGSGTQYFIGDFNGTHYIADDYATRIIDFGKDNYALQYVNPGSNPNELSKVPQASYIGWFSNWQYCQEVPSGNWRSAMTLARFLSIKKDWYDVPRVAQTPVDLTHIRMNNVTSNHNFTINGTTNNYNSAVKLSNASTAYEIEVKGKMTSKVGRLTLALTNFNSESLEIGLNINPQGGQVFIDRGTLKGFKSPFFTNDFSSVTDIGDDNSFNWRIIVDASLLEFYADSGLTVGSVQYFPESPLTHLSVSAQNGTTAHFTATIHPLKKTVDRETYN